MVQLPQGECGVWGSGGGRGRQVNCSSWPCPASLHLVTLARQAQTHAHCVYVTLLYPFNCLSALFCICSRCPCPCQTFGNLMSAAEQLSSSPFPLPSPCVLRFVIYSLQLHGCHSKLSRKRKLLCKHFAAPSSVYVTRKSSEVGLAYLLACFSCHPFYAIFLGYSGHLVTLASPGPFMAISKVKYELRLLAKSAQQAGNRKLGLLPAGYFKTHAHTLAER